MKQDFCVGTFQTKNELYASAIENDPTGLNDHLSRQPVAGSVQKLGMLYTPGWNVLKTTSY